MRLKNPDLVGALALSILNVLCALVPIELPWLRIVLALPLLFVSPGYLLMEMLFYRRKMAGSHRLLLVVSLSIVIVILNGLLLNLLAPGLQSVSWAICLSLESGAGALVVALRRGEIAAWRIRVRVLNMYEYCLFALALGGILFALGYAREGMAEQPYPGFTQFWLVRTGNNSCAVKLGVHSFELAPISYNVDVTANNMPVPSQFPGSIKPGEQVERTIDLSTMPGDTIDIHAHLYRLDRPGDVYRSVNIVLHRDVVGCT